MDYQYEEGQHYSAAAAAGGAAYGHQHQPHQHHHHHRAEVSQQLSRHHDLERGLNRMEESHSTPTTAMGPFLAQVVMEECREAKIRRQNRQVAITAGVTIGLIVAVIWFVVTR